MSETTAIEWCRATGGPWLGCTEVSPGCAECYARDLLETRLQWIVRNAYKAAGFSDWETRPVWGNRAPRVLTKGFWTDAYTWDRQAAAAYRQSGSDRWRVFPSMIDWLDDMPAGIIDQDGKWLSRSDVVTAFLTVVRGCHHLDWLLLTKRPENFRQRLADVVDNWTNEGTAKWCRDWLDGIFAPSNVWIGVSVEDQIRADERIPRLLKVPAQVRFLSCEPLLGPLSLDDDDRGWLRGWYVRPDHDSSCDGSCSDGNCPVPTQIETERVNWVIAGCESIGPKVGRNAHYYVEHARSLRDQCAAGGVAFFHKQMPIEGKVSGDPAEWPEDLDVREFPKVEVPA
jgi:protein gp37